MASRSSADPRLATLLAAAALFAAAELAAGLLIGRFFAAGRSEILLFLAYRPVLLLAATALASRFSAWWRYGFYAAALALAGASEALLVLSLGGEPWLDTLRGLAAGAALVAVADLVLQLGRRLLRRIGLALALVALASLFALPQGLRPYEELILAANGSEAAAEKPPLLLLTSLPIIWGEGGAFDPSSRPERSYRMLQSEFTVRPLDAVEPASLAGARLMLVAQPRGLAPEELVALDAWVREGGRILILTDPQLVWPSRWPLGDVRRPPPVGLLDPLLTHWGLRLEPADEAAVVVDDLAQAGGVRRLSMAAPGRFAATGTACALAGRHYLARCRIGRGEALLLADADMLRDGMWAGSGEQGGARHLRLADNPLIVADWLDRLGGIQRERASPGVRWLAPGSDPTRALLLALVPLLLVLAAAVALRLRHR